MDLQPGTLFDLPFVASLVRISGMIFVGAVVLAAGLAAFCVAAECEKLRRSMHRGQRTRGTRAHARTT